jgi:hypothetical protein
MSVHGPAIRVPVDASGNPTGPPQESSGFIRISIPAPKPEDDDTYIVGSPENSESASTINDFLEQAAAEEAIKKSDAIAEQVQARSRYKSTHGSEGTADGSSRKSRAGANSEQMIKSADSAKMGNTDADSAAAAAAHAQQQGDADSAAASSINADADISLIVDLAQFPEFSSTITNTFWGQMTQNSTTLDIIAVYLKGQKILYIDSKTHSENILNILMMPTILLSAISTVLSVALQNSSFGAILVACITGGSTFILSIISFLKLDAKAQAHKTSAYQFDKLQTMCEFFSGKVLLIKDKDSEIHTKVQKFVNEVEKKVEEIKDTNQYIIPEAIRFRYPIIYSTNVFSQIKKMKTQDKAMKNRLYFIVKELDALPATDARRNDLLTQRNKLLQKIVEHHNNLFLVDQSFNKEINKYGESQRKKCCYNFWNWFKI